VLNSRGTRNGRGDLPTLLSRALTEKAHAYLRFLAFSPPCVPPVGLKFVTGKSVSLQSPKTKRLTTLLVKGYGSTPAVAAIAF